MSNTPSAITAEITRLALRISPNEEPIFMTINVEPGCRPRNCHKNVRDKVVREGGLIQFGWSIIEWPRVMIEAEHHAVYDPEGGLPWRDITPTETKGMFRRLFVPDNSATYDFDNEGIRRDNVRVALTEDPDIELLFRLVESRIQLQNSDPGVDGDYRPDKATADKIDCLVFEATQLCARLAMRYIGQNDLCYCGEPKKYKRCCGAKATSNEPHS